MESQGKTFAKILVRPFATFASVFLILWIFNNLCHFKLDDVLYWYCIVVLVVQSLSIVILIALLVSDKIEWHQALFGLFGLVFGWAVLLSLFGLYFKLATNGYSEPSIVHWWRHLVVGFNREHFAAMSRQGVFTEAFIGASVVLMVLGVISRFGKTLKENKDLSNGLWLSVSLVLASLGFSIS